MSRITLTPQAVRQDLRDGRIMGPTSRIKWEGRISRNQTTSGMSIPAAVMRALGLWGGRREWADRSWNPWRGLKFEARLDQRRRVIVIHIPIEKDNTCEACKEKQG